MLASLTRQLVPVSLHIGIYAFKASKYLVYLLTEQKAKRKMFLDQLLEKSETRFSWDISGQSVPVILYCSTFLLKSGLNDIIPEKIKSSQFQQHWFLNCCVIYLKTPVDSHHLLFSSGHCFPSRENRKPEPSDQRAVALVQNVVRGTRHLLQVGVEPDGH